MRNASRNLKVKEFHEELEKIFTLIAICAVYANRMRVPF
jgi:hypothetical protein